MASGWHEGREYISLTIGRHVHVLYRKSFKSLLLGGNISFQIVAQLLPSLSLLLFLSFLPRLSRNGVSFFGRFVSCGEFNSIP